VHHVPGYGYDPCSSVNLKIITRLRIGPTFSENRRLMLHSEAANRQHYQGVEEVHKNLRHNNHHSVALNGDGRMLRAQAAIWLDWLLFFAYSSETRLEH